MQSVDLATGGTNLSLACVNSDVVLKCIDFCH